MFINKRGEAVSHGGKGSAPRKRANQEAYSENYDRVFGRGKKEKQNANLKEVVRLAELEATLDDDNDMVVHHVRRR